MIIQMDFGVGCLSVELSLFRSILMGAWSARRAWLIVYEGAALVSGEWFIAGDNNSQVYTPFIQTNIF